MTLRSIFFPKRASAVAAAILAACVLVAAPQAKAQKPAGVPPGPEKSVAATSEAEGKRPEMVEKRISDLHAQLKITPAEESAWNNVAQAIRDNAAKMKTLLDKWMNQNTKMTALENLKIHSEMADTHAQGLQKLVSAFESLYNMMPDDQKKIADDVFAYRIAKAHGKMKGKMKKKMETE